MTRRVLTIGEGLGVLRTAGTGSLEHEHQLLISTGGAEANVAIGLSRLGVPVTWLGRVGCDALGRKVSRELRAEGVTVHAIQDMSASTGAIIKETPRAGRTRVSYLRTDSAGSRLSPSDIFPALFDEIGLLHLTGITAALSSSSLASLERAMDLAYERGIPITFDVNHRSKLWPASDAAPIYRDIASRARVVFAGADEAALLIGTTDSLEHAASAVHAIGAETVVIKHGDRGALVLDGGQFWRGDAHLVDVVDTVGAGDAFVAGYLSGWIDSLGPQECVARANACGAMACLHPGDWEGAARLDELATWLADRHANDPVDR
ncbi:sugar kinase [Microbacterium sp. NPDC056234]|uniref:sugar kinase n=1 Tax=Microbacterium sp. NPDC056234 TaxID=3345757 RepID=UPI0035DB74E3